MWFGRPRRSSSCSTQHELTTHAEFSEAASEAKPIAPAMCGFRCLEGTRVHSKTFLIRAAESASRDACYCPPTRLQHWTDAERFRRSHHFLSPLAPFRPQPPKHRPTTRVMRLARAI